MSSGRRAELRWPREHKAREEQGRGLLVRCWRWRAKVRYSDDFKDSDKTPRGPLQTG